MDCSTGEPKVLQKVVATNFKEIWDILFAQKERLLLVIAKPGSLGFHAYTEDSGALKWSVVGSLPGFEKKIWPLGVTVDEKGRLFVCDSVTGNNCIQMFRVVDGNYLGCLIKKGDEGLRDINRVLWCEETKLLIVVHGEVNRRSSISIIKLK